MKLFVLLILLAAGCAGHWRGKKVAIWVRMTITRNKGVSDVVDTSCGFQENKMPIQDTCTCGKSYQVPLGVALVPAVAITIRHET